MRIGIDEFKFTSEIKSKINIQEAIISIENQTFCINKDRE